MSHRDQFVQNVDSQSIAWTRASAQVSREDLVSAQNAKPYSPIDHGNMAPTRNQGPSGSSSYANYPYSRPSYGQSGPSAAGSGPQYELSDMNKDPFQLNLNLVQPTDPFRGPEVPAKDPTPNGYSVVADAPYNANGMATSADFNNTHEYEGKDLLLEHQIRTNERNRRKLDARLPRFHFTKLPWFLMVATAAQVIMFIVELVKMGVWTGLPIQTQPYFNPMLGPSAYVLINMGARYVPCMHRIQGITLDTTIQFPCPNSTTTDTNVCSLAELCGLSGIPIVDNEYAPSQYYRIVIPIFLHAGFLHIIFNMLLQLTMGVTVERYIGWLKYSIIYITSGVAGFLLGANFSANGIASTGASGSLFGIIATNFLLFIYCGKKNTNIYQTKRYKTFILIMVIEILVSFVLGLLPGLDNFSHIGGFCMGILTSLALLPDPSFVFKNGIYTYDPDTPTWKLFVQNWNPVAKYQDKVPWKLAVWAVVRIASLVLAILYFVLLVRNVKSKRMEENEPTCSWCKYINCIPVNGWCEQGEVTVSTASNLAATATTSNTATGTGTASAVIFNPPTTTANAKRDMLEPHYEVFYEPKNAGVAATESGRIEALEISALFVSGVRVDTGSLALLAVLGLSGYEGCRRLKARIMRKRDARKERKAKAD